jgi:hypothetical protein
MLGLAIRRNILNRGIFYDRGEPGHWGMFRVIGDREFLNVLPAVYGGYWATFESGFARIREGLL